MMQEMTKYYLGALKGHASDAMGSTVRTLIIGLGGLGGKTVCKLKRKMLNRFGEPNETRVQFLVMDTDDAELHHYIDCGSLAEKEAVHLYSYGYPICKTLRQPFDMMPRAIKELIPPNWRPSLDNFSTAQIRWYGRLRLMDSDTYEKVWCAIQNSIKTMGNFREQRLEVHIITGLCGGTGSGICIDIPYLVRKVADSMGVPKRFVKLYGHLITERTWGMVQSGGADYMKHNCYAALKEIDYYMRIDEIREEFRAVYPDGEFTSKENIFDVGMIYSGMAVPDYSCIEQVVNNIATLLSRINPRGGNDYLSCPSDVVSSVSWKDDLSSGLRAVMQEDRMNFDALGNYAYTFMGTQEFYFPKNQICGYVIGQNLLNALSLLREKSKALRQDDIDAFAKSALAPLDLIRDSLDEFEAIFNEWSAGITWNKSAVADRSLESQLKLITDNIEAAFDRNHNHVEHAWSKLDQRAFHIFKDPERGPFFLERLLTDNAADAGLSGFFEKINSYATLTDRMIKDTDSAIYQIVLKKIELSEQISRFRLFGPARRDLDAFKHALKMVWKEKLKISLLKRLRDSFYLPVSKQIGACYLMRKRLVDKYLALVDILTYMEGELPNVTEAWYHESFSSEDNGKLLSEDNGKLLQHRGGTLEELKDLVLQETTAQIFSQDADETLELASRLLDEMMHHPDSWNLTKWAPEIAQQFDVFLSSQARFGKLLSKDLFDYFSDLMAKNPSVTTKGLLDSLPLLSAVPVSVAPTVSWGALYPLKNTFVLLPDHPCLRNGNQPFAWNNDRHSHMLWAKDQNTIAVQTFYSYMPLFILDDIGEYEMQYNRLRCFSSHINGGASMQPPYPDYPPLFPREQWYRASRGVLAYENKHEVKILAEISELVDKALEYGILTMSGYSQDALLTVLKERPSGDAFEAFAADPENKALLSRHDDPKAYLRELYRAFPSRSVRIASIGTVMPDSAENLKKLIRLQMRVFGLLRNEMQFLAELFQ